MKQLLIPFACALFGSASFSLHAQPYKFLTDPVFAQISQTNQTENHLYIDVHHLGKVNEKDLAAAHKKDLAVEKKYGVDILKYWVDTKRGDVYCLASCASANDLRKTHAEAHGLLPDTIYEVKEGVPAAAFKDKGNLYLDLHQLGSGKITAKDVAGAHKKDLEVQDKYGVKFIDYWYNEKTGTVMCLAAAPDSAAVINAHKEAHGLVPVQIAKVKQKQ